MHVQTPQRKIEGGGIKVPQVHKHVENIVKCTIKAFQIKQNELK